MRYEVREMSFAEILDTGFRLLRDHYVLLVGIAAALNLPLAIANQMGWEIPSPVGFAARWNGGPGEDAIELRFDGTRSRFAQSHFGHGVLSFAVGFLFRTPPGHNLWVTGPANRPKDGIR